MLGEKIRREKHFSHQFSRPDFTLGKEKTLRIETNHAVLLKFIIRNKSWGKVKARKYVLSKDGACWVGMCNERRRRKRQNDNQIDGDDENFVKKVKRQNDIMDQEIENVFSFVNAIFTITADKNRAERSPN